jgi:hypothetical protein
MAEGEPAVSQRMRDLAAAPSAGAASELAPQAGS